MVEIPHPEAPLECDVCGTLLATGSELRCEECQAPLCCEDCEREHTCAELDQE